jgi:hypothetical protein
MQGLLRQLVLSPAEDQGGRVPLATIKGGSSMSNCNMLSGSVPTPELKARFKSAYEMRKGKVRSNWGVEVDSTEYLEVWKMTH